MLRLLLEEVNTSTSTIKKNRTYGNLEIKSLHEVTNNGEQIIVGRVIGMKTITMNFDGACTDTKRDGDMGIGVHAQYLGEEPGSLFTLSEYAGIGTNNEAEYTALIKGMVELINRGLTENVVFIGDSEVVIKQMTGEYQIRNYQMFRYNNKVRELLKYFDKYEFKHVRRNENAYADKLSKKNLKRTLTNYYKYKF